MKHPMCRLRLRSAVRESFDNLPSGVCFFSESGLILLCNRQMVRLMFAMTGHDLQSLQELHAILSAPQTVTGAVRDGGVHLLPDGTAWRFALRERRRPGGTLCTEAVASNVTELRDKQRLLTEANEAKRQTVAALERIQQNAVAITREEEILAMKMKLHNEFGYNLQTIRRFFAHDCPDEEKEAFLAQQRCVLQKMEHMLGNDDTVDPFTELRRLAAALGMEIVVTGELPQQEQAEQLLAFAVRECLTNTIRHAQGARVYVALSRTETLLTARITNDGKPPAGEIAEGGGLSSLRARIESDGGTMTIRAVPRFALQITVRCGRKEGETA